MSHEFSSAIAGAQLKTSALIPIARGYVAAQQPDTAAKILSQSLSTAERIQSPNAVHKADALQQREFIRGSSDRICAGGTI